MLIYPAIDILGGKCVRLALGKFDDVTTYGDPVEQCAAFSDQGAQWIHIVDLDGAREGLLLRAGGDVDGEIKGDGHAHHDGDAAASWSAHIIAASPPFMS